MTLFATSRRGRPRKQGVPRYANGAIARGHRSDTEKPEAVTATAEEARIRQLLGVDVFLAAKRDERAMTAARKRIRDPLLGYALGRLRYAKEIDPRQYDAGMYFAWLWRAHAKVRGLPSPNVKALDYGAAQGLSIHPEDSDEWVADVRRKWADAYRFIFEAQKDFGPVFEILRRTLVEDIGPRNLVEMGNLRIGLNAINRARGA